MGDERARCRDDGGAVTPHLQQVGTVPVGWFDPVLLQCFAVQHELHPEFRELGPMLKVFGLQEGRLRGPPVKRRYCSAHRCVPRWANRLASNTTALKAPTTPTSIPAIDGSTTLSCTGAPGVSATISALASPTIAVS